MAADVKAKRSDRSDDQRQRPVQFRGLSTHYVAGENISVSFRYPASSFQPHSEDKVKLYASGIREKSVANALVGDTSKHRLCDGGLYKTGSVTLSTTRISGCRSRSYVLLYGSSQLRRVMGKSEPFIICRQDNFPSIQIRTPEDSVFIEKLRFHSPLGGVESDDHSFSLVSGGLSGGWELLEEEEGEDSSESEAWSDVGAGSKEGDHHSPSSSRDEEEPGETFQLDPGRGEGSENVPRAKVVTFSKGISSHDLPVGTDPTVQSEIPGEGSDSESQVMLKNANRELRTKVCVLHDKLHSVSKERDHLQERVEDVGAQLSLLQHQKSKLKHQNKKLAEEKLTLRAKNKDLMRENSVLTQHCEKQVTQLTRYHAQVKSLSDENSQLQQQLQRNAKPSPKSVDHREIATSDPVPATSAMKQKAVKIGRVQQKPVIDVYVRDSEKARGKGAVKVPSNTNKKGIIYTFLHLSKEVQGSSPCIA